MFNFSVFNFSAFNLSAFHLQVTSLIARSTVCVLAILITLMVSTVTHATSEHHSKANYTSINKQAIDDLKDQLQRYQQKDLDSRQQYFAYKAQAWLNYAAYEHSIKSKSAAKLHALASGRTILEALQRGDDKSLSLTTDIPASSALMRPDLWAILSALKKSALKVDKGVIIAPRELAFSEVALIWAAADQCQHGARQSGAHFRMAERWLEQARETYINAHDSQANVALENLIVAYYQKYAPLDLQDDVCGGLSLTL